MARKIDTTHIPLSCGVYFMKSEAGEILYIGKAKNLKKRVNSYFDKKNHDFKTALLVDKIAQIDFITTGSDAEAYILENNLIKEHAPYYNIQLKDSKSYPFIAIEMKEHFPRLYRSREKHRAGVKYFGPYPKSSLADKLLSIAQKYFKLRLCREKIVPGKKIKPCLSYHIGICPGYCQWKIPEADYLDSLKLFISFLNGKYSQLEKEIRGKMQEASANLNFEKAASYRDLLTSLEEMKTRQQVFLPTSQDIDVFGLFATENLVYIALLFFREGRLMGKRVFKSPEHMEAAPLLSEVLSRYYEEHDLPDKIYTSLPINDEEELMDFLNSLKHKKVEILSPAAGIGVSLLKMANNNARYEYLADLKLTQKDLALTQLKEILRLSVEPRRIEAYDIATIEGKWSVGACSAFFNGAPYKKHYRHFKIKYVEGQDDYKMLQETLLRRIRLGDALPDLFLIDGGKGQLSSALEALDAAGVKTPVISLAKKEELIYLPGQREPIDLKLSHPGLQILMAARDEVHRFANRLHSKLRSESIKSSALEKIPGIGPTRRKQLLKAFGSLSQLKTASLPELQQKGQLSEKLSQVVWDFFNEKKDQT